MRSSPPTDFAYRLAEKDVVGRDCDVTFGSYEKALGDALKKSPEGTVGFLRVIFYHRSYLPLLVSGWNCSEVRAIPVIRLSAEKEPAFAKE
jgi:hypothetical protein